MKKIAVTSYSLPKKIADRNRIKGVIGQDMYLSSVDYSNYIFNSGGIPALIAPINDDTYIETIAENFDRLLLTGGEDITPDLYGEEILPELGTVDTERDLFEIKLIKAFLNKNKSIFGICRGLQILNVFFEGSLYQDYSYFNENSYIHTHNSYKEIIHSIDFKGDFLKNIFNSNELNVNSHHHQFIKNLGKNLEITAISKDGIIEGIKHKDYNVFAVQWHPEMIFDKHPVQLNISKYFCGN